MLRKETEEKDRAFLGGGDLGSVQTWEAARAALGENALAEAYCPLLLL